MEKFLTLFPNAENVHLTKDVGMIPFVLNREYKYDASIACFENGDYPYLTTDVNGLKQIFIKQIFKSELLNVGWFLIRNFRKFNVLQCYHISKNSIFYLLLFKILHLISISKSSTYLKFDLDDSIKSKKLSRMSIFLLKRIDLLSVETKDLCDYLNTKALFNGRVKYVPNGYFDSKARNVIEFNSKDDTIITVGRIGSEQKNNELLLEAFKVFSRENENWKLELIGPIEKNFQPYIKVFFEENPSLVSRVFFIGNISDREILQAKYDKAKIFILTSRWEGFPLVFLEAIKSGCSLISPRFSCAIDVTDNEAYGSLFSRDENPRLLANRILDLVNDSNKLETDCLKIQEFAQKKFSWLKICAHINMLLNHLAKN
ncbi:glycosyltransferase family 4 protein [Pedobacter aquatilis]|uniref:glycosyltransferase family 4 protein n=1 Tax=Pedobacter aquatilis TaxID=351343 RepID=UPI002931BAB7|nr:glycosyltransferase family 4 protein [Pedobacter aquatilis]